MTPDRAKLAPICRGIAAVTLALCEIGASERTDHDLAGHIVEASGDVQALIDYAIEKLAEDIKS